MARFHIPETTHSSMTPSQSSQAYIRSMLCILIASFCLSLGLSQEETSNFPNRPIKLIIPFSAGGSSDTFARILAKTIRDENLLPQPIVIINVNGASGTIGSRRVKNARPDGHTIMMLHEAIITAKHAGLSPYGPEAFEPVAATGENVMILAAASDSPFDTLAQATDHAATNPDELIYGTAIGAPTHMVGLLVERAHGSAKFRFTQAGSGAQRISSLTGGHIDFSPFSIGEFLRYESAGIKAIAVFSPERQALIPNTPTSTELGLPVNSINPNYWWAPKGTPQERIDVLSAALEKAMLSPYVREKLALVATFPTFVAADELKRNIARRNEELSSVTLVQNENVPNFALWILGIAITLLAAVFARRRFSPQDASSDAPSASTLFSAKPLIAFGLTLLYASLIAIEALSYPIATTVYTLILCFIVGGFSLRIAMRAVPFALLMGFGLFYLFTQLLTIDLPG